MKNTNAKLCMLALIVSLLLLLSNHGLATEEIENTKNAATGANDVTDAKQKPAELKFTVGSKDYFIDDSKKTMNTAPLSRDARTLVPVRYVVEAVGGSIEWFPEAKKASMTVDSTTIILKVGESTASVNGLPKPIDPHNPKVVPINAYGRVFVPIRFVMESFDAEIVWNYYKRMVTIRYPKPELVILDHSKFSIKYPSNWAAKSTTDSVLFTSPEGNSINVVYENLETSMTIDQYCEKSVFDLESILEDERLIKKSTFMLANYDNRMFTYTASLDNTVLKFSQIYFVNGKDGFVLTYSGDPGMYFNYASVFDRVIQTFTMK